jgi:hypothetical protein
MKKIENKINSLFRTAGKSITRHLGLATLTSVLLAAGTISYGQGNNVIFKATLNGASETPPTSSKGSGTATLTYNTQTKTFKIVVTYSGVTATAAHIHKGAKGQSGDVVFPFPLPVTSPINYASAPLDAKQQADLYAGLYYINIHSNAFPAGEIRGQLIKQ